MGWRGRLQSWHVSNDPSSSLWLLRPVVVVHSIIIVVTLVFSSSSSSYHPRDDMLGDKTNRERGPLFFLIFWGLNVESGVFLCRVNRRRKFLPSLSVSEATHNSMMTRGKMSTPSIHSPFNAIAYPVLDAHYNYSFPLSLSLSLPAGTWHGTHLFATAIYAG